MAKICELKVQRDANGKIYSHIRRIWLVETPEERVRQEYLCVLVNEYGFELDQIGEEMVVTERGSGSARADFLIWRSVVHKMERSKPIIVVECKSDNIQIDAATYAQGANYAQYCQANFFVTHNNRQTKYWRVDHGKMMPNFDEVANIPHAEATDAEIESMKTKLRVFKEDEFADLLQRCHDVIRNRESHDPTKAFDETSKILFIKFWVERKLKDNRARKNIFSVAYLDEQLGSDPINNLFEDTKKHYKKDALFSSEDRINLRPETSKEIVRLLESYNLSDTSEDIKGIAFEKFLGRTFRGEIGQFFTPRPIVEFMIQMLAPKEGEIICDPASGSGGFLIRFFEIVRQAILRSADDEYRVYVTALAGRADLDDEEKARLRLVRYNEIQKQLDPASRNSRLWSLANSCIYGMDKNDRMARTSKMNMIMHGDGHGGVHHWNGFLNVNGIFEGRFDIILTNPPFGSKLDANDNILANDIELPEGLEEHYTTLHGVPYVDARHRLRSAINKPISSLYKLPRNGSESIRTEILFIERCLNLLKPGGRMGIVLPESVFNNPSFSYVRRFVESRAILRAIVSLPFKTFLASGATVKTSILFITKFSESERTTYEEMQRDAQAEADLIYIDEIGAARDVLSTPSAKQSDFISDVGKTTAATRALASLAARESNARLRETKAFAVAELSRLEEELAREAAKRLRSKARYMIYMYDAEKVGISATGGDDDNELLPNPRVPKGVIITALEGFQRFITDPTAQTTFLSSDGVSR